MDWLFWTLNGLIRYESTSDTNLHSISAAGNSSNTLSHGYDIYLPIRIITIMAFEKLRDNITIGLPPFAQTIKKKGPR